MDVETPDKNYVLANEQDSRLDSILKRDFIYEAEEEVWNGLASLDGPS